MEGHDDLWEAKGRGIQSMAAGCQSEISVTVAHSSEWWLCEQQNPSIFGILPLPEDRRQPSSGWEAAEVACRARTNPPGYRRVAATFAGFH